MQTDGEKIQALRDRVDNYYIDQFEEDEEEEEENEIDI